MQNISMFSTGRGDWMLRELLIVVGVLGSLGAPTHAEEALCDDRERLQGTMKSLYGVEQRSLGITTEGHLIEIFTNEVGQFFVLETDPDRPSRTCNTLRGWGWTQIPKEEGL